MNSINVLNWINFVSFILIILLPYSKNAALSIYEQKKYKHLLEGQGLYTNDDDIEILTINNFRQSITDSNQAWLIEFYNSWCGFCQRFAPSWKALGTDIKNWNDMIRIGAIDCSVDENFPLCREYEIMGYPTLRYFHEHYQPSGAVAGSSSNDQKNLGIDVPKGEDMTGHRHYLIQRMINEQIDGRGRIYPNLLLYNHSDTLQLSNNLPDNVQYTILIVESPESLIGREIALDLHKITNIIIRSAWSNNTELIDYLKIDKFPSVIAIDRNKNREILENPGQTRDNIKNTIKNYLKSKNINFINEPMVKNKDIYTGKWLDAEVPDMATLMQERARQALKERVKKMGDVVFQMDLETTLRYSLKHEIASVKLITGEKLDALRQYLNVLKKYFPFGHGGQMFLQELNELVTHTDQVKGADLAKIIDKAERDDSQVYSSEPQWLGCQGSTPNKRGYPCGLWKLFHYLTVNAAEQNSLKRTKTDVREVLDTMHGYIKNYFGCADCSRHFQEMAIRRDMHNVSSFNSSILWLWMAHNDVNRRLAGDDTEDPEFPKIQFPSKENCQQCRNKDDSWNIEQVLHYLKHMYSSINVRYIGSDTRILHLGLEGNNNIPQQSNGGSSIFKALDISMYFILYVISFFLLAILIRIFLKRGYRKKPYVHDLLGKV